MKKRQKTYSEEIHEIESWFFHYLRKYHYPKLTLLGILIIITYFIFSNDVIQNFVMNLDGFGYLGIFIAGLMFSFGFTTPFAIGFFITYDASNVFLLALIGAIGASISDLFIYKFIKLSFMDEFERIEKLKIFREMDYLIEHHIRHKIRAYLLFIFAGLIISSPLPDEVGITLLAGFSHIKPKMLALLSFVFNFLGIVVMLLI